MTERHVGFKGQLKGCWFMIMSSVMKLNDYNFERCVLQLRWVIAVSDSS